MQKNVSLAMILKNSDIAQAQKAIDSVSKFVDEICITIADSVEKELPKLKGDNIKYSYWEWNDNFSDARNFNFSQCTSDWVLWLDADDTLEGAENLKELIEFGEQNNINGFAFLYKYGFDKSGNCIDEHWKTQLLKNDGHFKWKGAIHEDPIQEVPTKWGKSDNCTRIHHTDEERTKDSYGRNLRILEKERVSNPKEPRTLFYLGRTYIAAEEWQKAVDVLIEYLQLSGWDEERYEAALLIGQAFFHAGQTDEALKYYNDAILEMEQSPDAYIYKGMCYLKKEDYKKALECFEIATKKKRPEANTYYNPMLYEQKLTGAMAIAYMHTGKFNDSLGYAKYCFQSSPEDEYGKEILRMITHAKEKYETSKSFSDLALKLETRGNKDNIVSLLHGVPSDLQDNPFITQLRLKHIPPKKWGKKSVVIYCGNSPEIWNPGLAKLGGIGGSETAVIEISKRLSKKGMKVTVFNNSGASPTGDTFDGVEYKNYWEFNFKDKFNILWVWRLPEIFDYDISAKYSLLDLHDVISPLTLTKERLKKIDKVFVKTKYHRGLFPDIKDDKFEIIGNGINYSRFTNKEKREPHRFIYSSTPNRGLDVILEHMWDNIRRNIPDAELHTYYGFNTFYELEKHNPERMAWMKKMQELMKKPGVVNHGRVNQEDLAKDIMKSSYWLYPTYFPEIHCITACEMQAGGAIPITSGYAALAETVKNGITLEGDVYDPKYHKKYIDTVIEQVKKDNSELRNKGIKDAKGFDWDNVADQWYDKIYGKKNKANSRD